MSDAPVRDSAQPTGEHGARLDSWKKIATYLKRTVRTAQRWEKEEGLPVRRHLHQKQSTVYAYTHEIDAWWRARRARRAAAPGLARRAGWFAGAAALAGVAVLSVIWLANGTDSDLRTDDTVTVAVLPFVSLNPGEQEEMLGYGFSEELMNRFETTSGLSLIAVTSAFTYPGDYDEPAYVADRLGVDYLVTGTVQRDGDDLRVRARLLDATGRQVWTASFDRHWDTLFGLLDEVAEELAAEIGPLLSPGLAVASPADPQDYAYLLGRAHLRLRHLDLAIAQLQQAVDARPDYAAAIGELALAKALKSEAVMDGVPSVEAEKIAVRALALDPNLASAHCALGILAIMSGRIDDGVDALTTARRLDPGLIEARYWLYTAYTTQGELASGERELQEALDRDPLHPLLIAELGEVRWNRGDFDGAREILERLLDLPTIPRAAYSNLVDLHREFGRYQDALHYAEEAALRYPIYTGLTTLAHVYVRLGMFELADFWIDEFGHLEGSSEPRLGLVSERYFYAGRFEDAVALYDDYVARDGRALNELPAVVQETYGPLLAFVGRTDEAVELSELRYGNDFDPSSIGPGHAAFSLTFAQLAATTYREAGRVEAASKLLEKIGAHIARLRESGYGRSPDMYLVDARNLLLLGNHEQALEALGAAVAMGWRNPLFERELGIFSPLRGDSRFLALMQMVDGDIARQRIRLEQRSLDQAFRMRVLDEARRAQY